MARKWKYLTGCALALGAALFMQAQFTPPGGGGGSGSVTSVGLAGTANQITVTGTSPITNSGSWTLSLPANLSGITGLTPGADFTLTQNSVAALTSVSSGAVVNTVYLTAGHALFNTTTDLGAILTVADTRNTSPRGILSLQNSDDTVGARVGFAKSRGTAASPTIVITGDTLGRSMYRGYDGSNYLEMASIEAVATGTIAVTRVPTYLAFSTATNATPSVLTEAARINATQNLLIGGTTEQNYKLSVEKSGTTGTANFQDLTATTGATRVNIGLGAADSASTVVFTVAGSQTVAGTFAATGNVQSSARLQAGTDIILGNPNFIGWSTRSALQSPSDGVIELSNAAVADFGRLQFGGTTSSFPALKRSTTRLLVRLADDSADAEIDMSTINISSSSFTFNGHTCTIVSTVVTCP